MKLTTMSFSAFSGLFANLIATAAAAPEDIPTCGEKRREIQGKEGFLYSLFVIKNFTRINS